MLVSEYNHFVRETDQYADKSSKERNDIALYGLVGEIGSLVSAVKKKLLSEGGEEKDLLKPNEEIIEELGDIVWYCFSLFQIKGLKKNIFVNDIALLKKEIGADNDRAKKIHAALDKTKKDQFLKAAESFPDTKEMEFDHYQKLAFLTARTDGQILLEVCLAVLWQLGAELLRKTLPEIELTLNKAVVDREPDVILGEIAWHVAAIASLYNLSLNKIAEKNKEKVSFRMKRGEPTPLHDEEFLSSEKFPRQFEVAFITVGKGISRMYVDGRQLGDQLTDNAYEDDGYRFHDVMHLANIAVLGWSPVLRGLMKRKRKSNKNVDQVEDGARAQIVEEAIVKAIHSEGVRTARERNGSETEKPLRLFALRNEITFKFLKFIREFVKNLEVEKNKYWEWENAIFQGYDVFYKLSSEGQGTVTLDLNNRTITFRPDVYIDIKGTVSGIGSAYVDETTFKKKYDIARFYLNEKEVEKYCPEKEEDTNKLDYVRVIAVKRAILEAIGIQKPDEADFKSLTVSVLDQKRVSIKSEGKVREAIWDQNVISFKTTLSDSNSSISCTALAISDPGDSKR